MGLVALQELSIISQVYGNELLISIIVQFINFL